MAADNARRLISKIVRERHIDSVLARGVTEDWFPSPEDRKIFRFLVGHYQKYNEVPTGVTLLDNWPNYRLLAVQDTLEYLLDQFCDYHRANQTFGLVNKAVDLMENPNDFEQVLEALRSGLADLDASTVTGTDIDLSVDTVVRWDEYLNRKNNPGGMLGLPTGFPTIDQATAGLQPGQLVTIVASPKTGKSQLALKIAEHIHGLGYPPMYQSFEMSNLEQQERFDALKAQVSHNRLRRGILEPAEEVRYRQMLIDLQGTPPFILSDSSTGVTVSALGARISTLRPAVVFVDGVYLMIDEVTGESNTPQALTNITRSFKRLAQRLGIPIVITTQTLLWKQRKNVITENSIGYSSSFLQDSDVILALERPEDEDEAQYARTLKVVASRHCGPVEAQCLWDWGAGRFEEVGFGSGPDPDEEDEYFDYQGVVVA